MSTAQASEFKVLKAILRKSQGWEIKTLANHVLDHLPAFKATELRGVNKAWVLLSRKE